MTDLDRRAVLARLGLAAGATLLLPSLSACGSAPAAAAASLPWIAPPGFDPIAFNRARGNAGAIPASYLPSVNGPDGALKHLGKHLPYVPALSGAAPEGYLPLMWGDPAKGYARHPNAAAGPANQGEGHWYNWVRVRKAVDGPAQEVESRFGGWPAAIAGDSGRYAAQQGDDPAADGGRNTVYLVGLPPDVRPGDTVRIHAHCLTHGEYVDFLTLPA